MWIMSEVDDTECDFNFTNPKSLEIVDRGSDTQFTVTLN